MKPTYKKRVREEHETSDISTESNHRERPVDLASCSVQDLVASVDHVEEYAQLDTIAEKLQTASTRVQDVANKRFAAAISHPTSDTISTLYRRSLKLTKAHEHDVDTNPAAEPGRTIRDITCTFTLGLTSETAQQLNFRLVNDTKDEVNSIDAYLDWITPSYRPPQPSTTITTAATTTEPAASGPQQASAAPASTPSDKLATELPAAPAAAPAVTLPGPPLRRVSSRMLAAGAPCPPVNLFMLEMEAEETITVLSRRYNTVEWHKPAFEALRAAAGLGDVDKQPVMHFVRELGLLVLELIGSELGEVDDRGVRLGLSTADFEHLVRPLYG